MYLSEGSRLEKMIAIGHELGHIYLDHLCVDGVQNSDNLSKNKIAETQATYFAESVVKRRSDKFRDSEYIKERKLSDWIIHEKILEFQPDYDEAIESLLGSK